MLRALIICPDNDLRERFERLLEQAGDVHVTRTLERYPNSLELLRLLRSRAPHVVFLSVESMARASEIVRDIEKNTPGVQIMALSRDCDPQVLLDLMRAGIREFASLPFDRQNIQDALIRLGEAVAARPPVLEATDNVFSFLPSKAGVGASTVALNAAVALSRMPDTHVLLSDFDLNSGMVRFMLKLENDYGVTDAAEHAFAMDDSLWPQMISTVERLDVLHAGRLNPDYRMEPSQIRHLLDFMRRNYQALCFDFSGNLEKYSLEIMHESKKIFLVCTPELPSLHLAREKYLYLKQLELHDRISVLLNRCQKRPIIAPKQIEELLGLPVQLILPNDYQGVHRALTLGRSVEPAGELGKQISALAETMIEARQKSTTPADNKKHFLEYFSVVPGRYALGDSKKPAV